MAMFASNQSISLTTIPHTHPDMKINTWKTKASACVVLGAALVTAQHNRHVNQQAEGKIMMSLQDSVQAYSNN